MKFFLKWKWWILGTLAFASALCFASVPAGVLPEFIANECRGTNQTDYENCAVYHVAGMLVAKIGEWLRTASDVIVAMSGMAVAAFTATLWWSTDRLWKAGKIQAGFAERAILASEREAKIRLRAYVSIAGIRFTGVKAGGRPGYEVKIINSGTTPAKRLDVTVWGSIGAGKSQGNMFAPKDDSDTNEMSSVSDIPPNISFPMSGFIAEDGGISDSAIFEIVSGKKVIVLAGIIKYRDVFNVQRRTIFKTMLDAKSVDAKGGGVGNVMNTGNRSS